MPIFIKEKSVKAYKLNSNRKFKQILLLNNKSNNQFNKYRHQKIIFNKQRIIKNKKTLNLIIA